jgi:predicted TIM-barrel fold metal-dependent hydrolase
MKVVQYNNINNNSKGMTMAKLSEHQQWLQLRQEEIIDPLREIVDPHHHLWRHEGMEPYLLEDLHADTGSGHNICKTVFIECGAEYRIDGPEHLRSVGETEFAAALAKQSDQSAGATIAGIVAHTDLCSNALVDTMAVHAEAAQGRLRGIRHALSCAPGGVDLMIPGRAPRDLYKNPQFQAGVQLLGQLGYSYDSWHYHFQNSQFLALTRTAPNTTMVLDHFGTPLGVGKYASQRQEIYQQWKKDIVAIAQCDNAVVKLGGLAMPDNGFGWFGRKTPPTSDEFVAAQGDYFHHMIECFGPQRCMFESNFPVDKLSISYPVLWNALKKIASRYSESEQQSMFSGTATQVYRLD